jgi:hypothetical protein
MIIEWLDAHSGAVQAIATIVLVAITAYYAWTSRSLVQQTRQTLQASSRNTLQSRLDHISDVLIREPGLFARLDDPTATGEEEDTRFHVCSMFLGVLEEAYQQFRFEHSMTRDDWSAWQATADNFLPKTYVVGYWRRVQGTFEPNFRRFVNQRLARAGIESQRPTA